MQILKKVDKFHFPLNWANLDNYRESNAYRVEIYLKEPDNSIDNLIELFHSFFGKIEDDILIFNKSWWDYSLEVWNIEMDIYDYTLNNKSSETRLYLEMLIDSDIEIEYSNSCKCLSWNKFLSIILGCLMKHQAPYSPLFYNQKFDFYFYFHYSGSIGLYFKEKNELISNIFEISNNKYIIDY